MLPPPACCRRRQRRFRSPTAASTVADGIASAARRKRFKNAARVSRFDEGNAFSCSRIRRFTADHKKLITDVETRGALRDFEDFDSLILLGSTSFRRLEAIRVVVLKQGEGSPSRILCLEGLGDHPAVCFVRCTATPWSLDVLPDEDLAIANTSENLHARNTSVVLRLRVRLRVALAESLTTLAIRSLVSFLSSVLAGLAVCEDLEMLDLREAGMQNVMRRSSIRQPERCHPTQRKTKKHRLHYGAT